MAAAKRYTLDAATAQSVDEAIGFTAKLVRIDNYTSLWVYDGVSRQYIAPKTYRAVIYQRTELARISFAAPAGTTQGTAVAGEQVLLVYEEEDRRPAAKAAAAPASFLGLPLPALPWASRVTIGPEGPTGPAGPPGESGSSPHIVQDGAANLPAQLYLSVIPEGIAQDDASNGKTVLRLDLLSVMFDSVFQADAAANVDPIDQIITAFGAMLAAGSSRYVCLAYFSSHNATGWKSAASHHIVPAGRRALYLYAGGGAALVRDAGNRKIRLWNYTTGAAVAEFAETGYAWGGDLATPSAFAELSAGTEVGMQIWNSDGNKRAIGGVVLLLEVAA